MTLKRIFIFTAAVAAICLVSCKGRTTDTVEPTGETVEVVIGTSDPEAAETDIPLPSDSLENQNLL